MSSSDIARLELSRTTLYTSAFKLLLERRDRRNVNKTIQRMTDTFNNVRREKSKSMEKQLNNH